MLEFYWSLGKDIVNLHAEHRWGSNFFENLSNDMLHLLPDVKGFSVTNLRYMKRFYELFSVSQKKLPQVGAESVSSVEMEILPQVGANLFSIPWGHMKAIIDKCRDNPLKASFYVNQVRENAWSRAVLLNFLDTDLFERQGRAITNFKDSLPDAQSGLAQEMTKDPYSLISLLLESGGRKAASNAGGGYACLCRELRPWQEWNTGGGQKRIFCRLFGDGERVSGGGSHAYLLTGDKRSKIHTCSEFRDRRGIFF